MRWVSRRLTAGVAALLASVALASVLGAAPEPEGYRLDDYHAPVPSSVKGGTVISSAAALQSLLARENPILIDVLPAPRRPEGMKPAMPWLPAPHLDIPGSVWLPDSGRGALSPAAETWFRAELAALTQGDRARPLVFYCQKQCWMSWNAAKRAATLGYRRVFWYPDGVDGWKRAGLTLAPAKPTSTPPEGTKP